MVGDQRAPGRGVEERLRTIVESQPAALAEVAGDGRVLAMNAACRALFRVAATDTVVGESIAALVPEAEAERVKAFVVRVCALRRAASHQCRLGGPEGNERVLHIDAVPLRRGPDEGTAALLVATDITLTRTLERALRLAEQQRSELAARVSDVEERVRELERRAGAVSLSPVSAGG